MGIGMLDGGKVREGKESDSFKGIVVKLPVRR